MINYNLELEKVTIEVNDMKIPKSLSNGQINRYIERRMNYFQPQVNIIKNRLNNYNPIYFETTEYFDHLSDSFDLYVITGCSHFIEIEDAGLSGESNVYVDIMREIQTKATVIFFILVHIPLSRFNSIFCAITSFVPMMLNIKTKYWFYE